MNSKLMMNTNSKLIMKWTSVLIIISTASFNSCKECECEPPIENGETLVEATNIGGYTRAELQLLLEASDSNVPSSVLNYDVTIYNITYRTTYKDNEIIASGVVVLPVTANPLSMFSLHHGTIVAHDDAPTAQPLESAEMILYAALSSIGFIGVIPDYIGFGNTSYLLHPYYVEEFMASSIIDNLKAAGDLASLESVNFNGKLFLGGYSEGGYATMAAHKYVEQNGLPGFDLIASFPAAGGYDVKGVQEHLFAQETYGDPFYIAYISMAYKTTLDWTQPLSDIFNEPYASSIPNLFNGNLTASAINGELTESLSELIKADLLANIDTNPQYNYIVDALTDNSLTDWVPVTPMYMYHGDADVTVPYQNSVSVHEQFLANGASADILQFITLEGADHSSGAQPYIEDVVSKVLTLQ